MMWKVIEGVSGRVQTYASPEAESHPNWESHEQLIWEGEAVDRNDAILKAAQADPRLDVKHRRIRHELSL